MKYFLFIIGSALLFAACSGEQESSNTALEVETPTSEIMEQPNEHASAISPVDDSGNIPPGGINLVEKIKTERTVRAEQEAAKTANYELMIEDETETTLHLQLILKNPELKEITSARSFIAYNPEILHGDTIEFAEDSPFDLAAPGERDFDSESGLVKIGLSATDPTKTKLEQMVIADMHFIKHQNDSTMFDFFDVSGANPHTVVLEQIAEDQYRNILQAPSVPALRYFPTS
jgi:hypothetical protein